MASREELEAMGITEDIKKEAPKNQQEKKVGISKQMKFEKYKTIMKNTENMILTTTNNIKGYNITDYIGIVAGTDIYLVGGVFGGGITNQENLYTEALSKATIHLKQNAEVMGANAIIGISVNVTSPGGANHMIVVVTGTAVKIKAEA